MISYYLPVCRYNTSRESWLGLFVFFMSLICLFSSIDFNSSSAFCRSYPTFPTFFSILLHSIHSPSLLPFFSTSPPPPPLRHTLSHAAFSSFTLSRHPPFPLKLFAISPSPLILPFLCLLLPLSLSHSPGLSSTFPVILMPPQNTTSLFP